MAIDARSLRYFAEVVASGSMSRATQRLGVSQPALSKCIREMEFHLGVRLLERSSSGVVPTQYGRTLYSRATSVTAEIARAEAEIRALAHSRTGLVCVGVLPSQMLQLMPAATLRLLANSPTVNLRVVERARDELFAGLLRSEFDLIVSVISPEHAYPNISSDLLFYDHPSIVLRKGHPAAAGSKTQLRRLARYPWVIPPFASGRGNDVVAVLNAVGIRRMPQTMIECHSQAFLKSMVIHSDSIGLLPSDAATPEEEIGILTSIPLKKGSFSRAVGLLYRSDFPLTQAAHAVSRAIKAVARPV